MSLRREVARQAYVWGLPTVHLHRLLHTSEGPPSSGGEAACVWLDLRGGPLQVERSPDPAVGAPAVTTLLDLHADVIGTVPDDRGGPLGPYVLAGPSWEPPVAAGAAVVLRCPTDLCLAVGGIPRVRPCVDRDGSGEPLPLPPPVPPVDVRLPPTLAFLEVLDWMLALMPPRPGEEELRADLQMIGVTCGPGALADVAAEDRLDGEVTEGLRLGFEDARRSGLTDALPLHLHLR